MTEGRLEAESRYQKCLAIIKGRITSNNPPKRRVPNSTHGVVGGRGLVTPSYPIFAPSISLLDFQGRTGEIWGRTVEKNRFSGKFCFIRTLHPLLIGLSLRFHSICLQNRSPWAVSYRLPWLVQRKASTSNPSAHRCWQSLKNPNDLTTPEFALTALRSQEAGWHSYGGDRETASVLIRVSSNIQGSSM